MAFHGKDHVVTCAAIVLWDGITKPEVDEKDGSLTHNLRVAIPNNAPELAEVTQVAQAALNGSQWKGTLPPGGNWPLIAADVSKFGPTLAGHTCFTVKTRRGAPEVFDANGATLTPIVYGRQFYPGSRVQVMLHAYAYDNKQKGIALGLDGIKIVDSTAPALAIGGGVSPQEVANAFGAAGGAVAGPVMLGGADYNAYKSAGWSDAQMIDAGHMQRPVAAPPPAPAPLAPPPPPGGSAAAPPPPAPVQPHPSILTGPVMLGGADYNAYKSAGWSDAQMIDAGHMQRPVAAPPPAPAPLAPPPPPGGSAAAPPPPAPIAPAAPGKTMLPAANGTTYEQYLAAGWSDAQMIAGGVMAA